MKSKKLNLPAPRLELRWEPATLKSEDVRDIWERKICRYNLVLPLREFDIRRDTKEGDKQTELTVELSSTTCTGGSRPVLDGVVNTPFRDGAHAHWDSKVLGNLPIFAICGNDVTRIEPEKEEKGPVCPAGQ